MEIPEHFWLIWRRWHRQPHFIHETLESAKIEAERLSKEYPLGAFFILEVVQKVGPGTEPPPVKPPKKAKIPQPELTPEEKAARAERKAKRKAHWEAQQAKKSAKSVEKATEVKSPLTIAEIRRKKQNQS